ncbi:unnamed protein product [Trifolium pratense]|uniref:Uncharacterized protein n=1 Tax=Trifolium pratense TaxID=57577 RepID=A0ACB0I7J4_TRIPR|nr:unnamed protein product [Trifolium pratense]
MSHLAQVKRILKYVNGTCDYGILYTHGENSMLVGYCDADWAGCADDRKSTSGACFFLGNNLISWFSKKQNCVSLSTAEAEYIAAGSSCSQLLWMKQMLLEYNVVQDAMALYCDNLSAINISKNPIQHSRTKHIDIRHHFIRDLVEEDDVIVPDKEKGSEATTTDNVFVHDIYVIPYVDDSGKTMFVPLNVDESAEKDSNVIYVDNLNLTERTPASSSRRLRSNADKGVAVSNVPVKTAKEKKIYGLKRQWSKITEPSEPKKKLLRSLPWKGI